MINRAGMAARFPDFFLPTFPAGQQYETVFFMAPSLLLKEIWQFHPLSSPIFSENTLDRSSFSLLKCTNLMHAFSNKPEEK